MTTTNPDLVERLNDIWSNDDHARGCQGREYSCTCGFDERTFATAKEAAARIEELEAERDFAVASEQASDEYVALQRARIEELEQALEWRPIETAPKDGTEIVLWGVMRGHTHPWKYIGNYFNPYAKDGWWQAHTMPIEATYWVPLPEPLSALGAS